MLSNVSGTWNVLGDRRHKQNLSWILPNELHEPQMEANFVHFMQSSRVLVGRGAGRNGKISPSFCAMYYLVPHDTNFLRHLQIEEALTLSRSQHES